MIFDDFPIYFCSLIIDSMLIVKFICQCLKQSGKTQPTDQSVTQLSEKIATPPRIRIASASLGSSANPSKNLLSITREPSILNPNLRPLTSFRTRKGVLLTCKPSPQCSIRRKKCGRIGRGRTTPLMRSASN